jgi:hypothetical protein
MPRRPCRTKRLDPWLFASGTSARSADRVRLKRSNGELVIRVERRAGRPAAETQVDQSFKTPFDFATWVAIASISGGDRQS